MRSWDVKTGFVNTSTKQAIHGEHINCYESGGNEQVQHEEQQERKGCLLQLESLLDNKPKVVAKGLRIFERNLSQLTAPFTV